LPDRLGRVPRSARRARKTEAERRGALLRAGDLTGARLRLPLWLPRPVAHGDRPRAARARVRPRPDRDGAERRVPRANEGRRGGRGAQPGRDAARDRARRGAVHQGVDHRPEGLRRPRDGAEHRAARALRPHGVPLRGAGAAGLRAAARRDRARLLRPAEVAHARLRELRLRRGRVPRGQPRARRRADRRRGRRRAVADRPPRRRLRARPCSGRAAARGDPAAVLRRAGPGGDRLPRDRARDDQGEAQGRARQVLRRRHHPQAEAARAAEEGQEADEAGRAGRSAARGVPRGAQPGRGQEVSARHLYVHLPFCASRCGYCDFVTVVGRSGQHDAYVVALLAELELERAALAPRLESAFLGGGTPTLTEPRSLERLLRALPPAEEVTVEANPETITPELAALLRRSGVTRVSLGAQSFQQRLLEVLERRARPEDVRRAFALLREAGFDNLSLDLIYGIPGQTAADLEADLAETLAL